MATLGTATMAYLKMRILLVATLPALVLSSAGFLIGFPADKDRLSSDDILEDIAGQRVIEARLAVDDQQHSSCESAQYGPADVPWLDCRAERGKLDPGALRKLTDRRRDPRISGLAYLIWSRDAESLEKAIERLQAAHRSTPEDPAIANDLAAMLTERAGRANQPADLLAALELIEQARVEAPSAPWLLFNRALLLEKLQMLTLARQAWSDYLQVEASRHWKAEAEEHITRLDTRKRAQSEPVTEHLLEATQTVDKIMLLALAARHPRETREFATDIALPAWGEATLAGQLEDAERWLHSARILGEELVRLGGDRTALEAVEAIEATKRLSPLKEEELAQAHRLFGQGHRLYKARDYDRAAHLLKQARPNLAAAKSPLVAWLDLDLAAGEMHGSNNEEALDIYKQLMARADLEALPSLSGRTAWAMGLSLFRLGYLEEALVAYKGATKDFLRARESDNRAAILGLIAETLAEMGKHPLDHPYRYAGLRHLGGQARHRSSHNLLWEAGQAALEQGYKLTAEAFANEDIALFEKGADPLLALESHFRKGQFLQEQGRVPEALAAFYQAERISYELPNSPLLARVQTEVELALAALSQGHAAEHVEPTMEEAIRYFHRHKLLLRETETLLERARLRKLRGKINDAWTDLNSATKLLESQRARLSNEVDRVLFGRKWQGVYDELIELAASLPNGPSEALRALERSTNQEPGAESIPDTFLGDKPLTVLAFSFLPEKLIRFQIVKGKTLQSSFYRSHSNLHYLIQEFSDSIQFDLPLRAAFTELTSLLIPENIPPGSRICVVPDPDQLLTEFPFSALPLPDGTGPLITRYEIIQARSVADCQGAWLSIRPGTGEGVLLAGSPRLDKREFSWLNELPRSASELSAIHHQYPEATLIVGQRATAPAILNALRTARILHFSGHAISKANHTQLPLAPDSSWPDSSIISEEHIARLELQDLKLVVLSTCRSISIATPDSRGLAEAFHVAGVQAVVGTIWPIEDNPGRHFSIHFHQRLAMNGDPAAAVREAQLQLLSHPSRDLYKSRAWSAFALTVSSHQDATDISNLSQRRQ